MSENLRMHPLDSKLLEFDNSLSKDSPPESNCLIYAFLQTSLHESTARFDASALRTCLIVNCIRHLYKFRGKNYSVSSSDHDSLFKLIQNEFGWTFSTTNVKSDDCLELLRRSASKRSGASLRKDLFFAESQETGRGGDTAFSFEALEAAKIVALLSSNLAQNSECRLVAVVPEVSSRSWEKVRTHVEGIFHALDDDDGEYKNRLKISTVIVGSVIFVNSWAKSIIDYFKRRQEMIDSSYRHKFMISGGDESCAPISIRRSLTFATIVFELMAYPSKRSVAIEEIGNAGHNQQLLPDWARNGTFVLYNFARLSAILTKHERGVDDGHYPHLQPIDTLDQGAKTTVLEEMSDLIDWLSRWSNLDTQLTGWSANNDPSVLNLRNDMFTVSRRFSVYYSKHRVLTECVSFNGKTADVLRAKIHVLSRLKKLYGLWFEMFAIRPVEVM